MSSVGVLAPHLSKLSCVKHSPPSVTIHYETKFDERFLREANSHRRHERLSTRHLGRAEVLSSDFCMIGFSLQSSKLFIFQSQVGDFVEQSQLDVVPRRVSTILYSNQLTVLLRCVSCISAENCDKLLESLPLQFLIHQFEDRYERVSTIYHIVQSIEAVCLPLYFLFGQTFHPKMIVDEVL